MPVHPACELQLAQYLSNHLNEDGVFQTIVPTMTFIRESLPSEPIYRVNEPSICIVAQGEKQVFLGTEKYRYGPSSYIVSSIDLPLSGNVVKASAEKPYLAMKLELSHQDLFDIADMPHTNQSQNLDQKQALYIGRADRFLLDAAIRMAKLTETPEDIAMLSPLYKKEIIYRVLQGPHGVNLRQLAKAGTHIRHIQEVISYLLDHYTEPIKVEVLAGSVNMSTATFHRHFKELTTISPLQFQKQLRLQEARRLLFTERADAKEAAYQVGYESPTQFSREYARLFGVPPKEDARRFKEMEA